MCKIVMVRTLSGGELGGLLREPEIGARAVRGWMQNLRLEFMRSGSWVIKEGAGRDNACDICLREGWVSPRRVVNDQEFDGGQSRLKWKARNDGMGS